jgi:hypothetical protein
MDHFKTFDPAAPPFQEECLFNRSSSLLEYDYLGYFGFPERKGWAQTSGNGRSDFVPHPQEEVDDELLQSWLYIGLLSEWTNSPELPLEI